MKLRENALLKIQPQVFSPTTSHPSFVGLGRRYRWKVDIVTTVFWVGERSSVPNTRSAWDTNWVASYGGVDTPDPVERRNSSQSNSLLGRTRFIVLCPTMT